ncbi:DUF2157 domain-containing protein [Campylobacter sp. RM16192]|uniref:DUF2157 domain-containing protein n=1 Tax=Campylobacter sp. RM16192 TaxID=1660080 RepID=UPI0014514EC4|nr:DUF2157 domain-containing protein [Campylobacter sp. RM16192]QCD52618.1 hypothetical membrane protein (DUF2157 domain) [Campylobacter sp. RM16192]
MIFLNKNFLANELVKWRNEGLIDRVTSEKIAARYDIDLQNVSDKKSFILKLVAYLFLALSLITIVGDNWEEIPRVVRLLIIISILAFVNLSALFMLKKGRESTAISLFFLGNFCYGIAIALIAQIYHLGEHMPNGVLLWAVGAFVLSISTKKSILITQSLAIALLWFIMDIELRVSHEFLIFIAISFYMLLKDESKALTVMLFISIFVYIICNMANLSSFEFSQFMWYITINQIVLIGLSYSLFGISLSLVAQKFNKIKIAVALRWISLITGIAILLFAMSFISHRNYDYIDLNNSLAFYGRIYGVLHIVFATFSLIILAQFKRYYVAILALFLLILPFGVGYFFEYSNAIYSILSVITGAVLIKQDYLKLGLSTIFIVANVRYFDLIGDYIGTSLLFLLFAVIVLVVSRNKKAIKNES